MDSLVAERIYIFFFYYLYCIVICTMVPNFCDFMIVRFFSSLYNAITVQVLI